MRRSEIQPYFEINLIRLVHKYSSYQASCLISKKKVLSGEHNGRMEILESLNNLILWISRWHLKGIQRIGPHARSTHGAISQRKRERALTWLNADWLAFLFVFLIHDWLAVSTQWGIGNRSLRTASYYFYSFT